MNTIALDNGILLIIGQIAYQDDTRQSIMVRSDKDLEIIIVKTPRTAIGNPLDPPEIYLPAESIVIRKKT